MLTEVLVTLFLVDSLRLWRRATNYPCISSKERPLDEPVLLSEYRVLAAPGVHVPENVIWSAVQWADAEGVLVVDLTPSGLSAGRSLAQLHLSHPIDYAQRPFAQGITAGVALLVHESIWQLNPITEEAERSLSAWVSYAQSMKRFAPWESALLLVETWELTAAELKSIEGRGREQREAARRMWGSSFEHARWATPILFMIFGWLVWSDLTGGLIALAVWMLQPALILHRQGFARQVWLYSAFRPLFELWEWINRLGPVSASPTPAELAELKETYQELLKTDTSELFHERREDCPICGATTLERHLSTPDLYQHKPGRFILDRCAECDHIFQNPQLNLEGLSFYYRDFYDGLGERGMDLVFGASETSYRQRVAMIRAHGAPKRWLDVGGGHGHFVLIAKHLMPQTDFDLLDLSESVEIAAQRRWCRRGIRGLFPERAQELKGEYDGISMSHYLEHTTDPIAELDAAAEVLGPEGLLMIEVPDPESRIGRALGWLWLPWFQPQHLHLLSTTNLTHLLRERGFEIAEIDRHQAHQSVDFFFCALLLVQRFAPDPNTPWSAHSAPLRALLGLWRLAVSLCCLPFIVLGVFLDRALRPLLSRPKLSNTQRILAVKSSLQR